jgi:hypothetical protein
MDFDFTDSAFKHGFTRDDAIQAFELFLFKGPMVGEDEGKWLVIGFSMEAVLLEIIYTIEYNGDNRVFHIMECRECIKKRYLKG